MGEKFNPKRFIELKKGLKSKSQLDETIAERLKLKRQKGDDKDRDLFEKSSHSTDDDSDEFNDIPYMPPLESDKEEVKEGKE